ncbi:MAG TPA: arsenate reductase ArsC [Syntrophales bacterium]|nr:arsenate reductase ArsC [Syntrophales bacterium]
MKKRVLFICTSNSCRSQMAEGLVNHELGDKIEAYSAGTTPTSVNPRAIQSMAEIGIDISAQRSKNMTEFEGRQFDYVITLCDSANEQCPLFFGGVKKIHMGFDDPVTAAGSEEEIMAAFRRVRDEIKDRLLKFFQTN